METTLDIVLQMQKEYQNFIDSLSDEDKAIVEECRNRIHGIISEFELPAIYAVGVVFYEINVTINKTFPDDTTA